MAWTTPGTAVAGDVLTAAFWNSNVRDNISDLDTRVTNDGLVFISATTLTTVGTSGQTLSNIFSTTYDNYIVYLNLTAISTTLSVQLQLDASGTPSTTGYWSERIRVENTSGSVSGQSTSGSNMVLANQTGSLPFSPKIEIANPFLATLTQLSCVTPTRGGTWFSTFWSGWHTAATSYTGLKIFTDTGTITGTARVYGYKK
jgi:hypothetical protein